MDLTSETSSESATPPPNMMLTENSSATYAASNDACLDFFFQIVPDTSEPIIVRLLEQAWAHDSLRALKLVFHLRAVRGTGKSNKDAFYICASWLCKHHPKTLVHNLRSIPAFGYYKDLLEILSRELHQASDPSEESKEKRNSKAMMMKICKRKAKRARTKQGPNSGLSTAERIALSQEKDKKESRVASERRREKRLYMTEHAKKKYEGDAIYATLFDAVVDIFAKQLLEDKDELRKKNYAGISYAAKWAPSDDKRFDRFTGLHAAIARKVFIIEARPTGIDVTIFTSILQNKLNKEYLTPLRKALEIPERYMSESNWSTLPYERVPSVAMKNYVGLFAKHDKARYMSFLLNVSEGNKKVAAGALLPHNIVREAVKNTGKPQAYLAEAQWNRMVSDLKKMGSKLNSSLAVCDVSGSMSGTPMEVCIALGMLVAELADEPWKSHVCTFSNDPQIHILQGKTLAERYQFTSRMNWDMNTDFQAVFRKLLEMAEQSGLPPEGMIQRLFVFSDMEFDQASANPWETDYMKICEMYAKAEYTPPEIVFWNLRDSRSTPVLANQQGVALVSGFSKNLLKVFLEDAPLVEEATEEEGTDGSETVKVKKSIDPMEVMTKALSDDLYLQLQVVD